MIRRVGIVSLCASIWACSAAGVESTEQPIVGGVSSPDQVAVAYLETSAGKCTATLVSNSVLLTAAHCVFDAIEDGDAGVQVSFGASTSSFDEVIAVDRMVVHPGFEPPQAGQLDIPFDVALVHLQRPPLGVTPAPWRRSELPPDLVGTQVTVVGFGVASGDDLSGAGVRRELSVQVAEQTGDRLGLGDSRENICFGDSGGPTLLAGEVVAVISFTQEFCTGRSFMTRTDRYEAFIAEVIAAWDGPCAANGVCETVACGEFADPDCGGCGFDGVCGDGCDADLDCPFDGGQASGCGCRSSAIRGSRGASGGSPWGMTFILVVLAGIAWNFGSRRIGMCSRRK